MTDLACLLALLGTALLVSTAYAMRVAVFGPAQSARVDREGESRLVSKTAMELFYWVLGPVGALCIRFHVGPNAITFASLGLGLLAGASVGAGHLGVGATLCALSAACDGLDGFVARKTGKASDAGEVLDAAVDRYVELAFLAGVAVHLRASVPLLVLTMLAVSASFMVSYSTAKAEALHATPPRGSMRRAERALYLTGGAALVPLFVALHSPFAEAPLIAAVALVAAVGNVSAVRRLMVVAREVRAREARHHTS